MQGKGTDSTLKMLGQKERSLAHVDLHSSTKINKAVTLSE